MHNSIASGKMHASQPGVAVQHRLSSCNVVSCKNTYEDLLFIQLCKGPTPVHSSIASGKMHASQPGVAAQHKLTAGFNLLFIQVHL